MLSGVHSTDTLLQFFTIPCPAVEKVDEQVTLLLLFLLQVWFVTTRKFEMRITRATPTFTVHKLAPMTELLPPRTVEKEIEKRIVNKTSAEKRDKP